MTCCLFDGVRFFFETDLWLGRNRSNFTRLQRKSLCVQHVYTVVGKLKGRRLIRSCLRNVLNWTSHPPLAGVSWRQYFRTEALEALPEYVRI